MRGEPSIPAHLCRWNSQKTMSIILVIIGVALVLGVAVVLLDFAEVPEGYEDVHGFHLGPEPEISGIAVLASPLSESGDDGANAALAETEAERHGARTTWSPVGLRQRGNRAPVIGIGR